MSIEKDYIVLKVLNNNVILAVGNKTRQELILVGKGIGFGKKEGQNKKVAETMKDTRFLKEIIDLIQKKLSVSIDNKDLMYTRLVNHLRVTINRLEEKKYIENPLLDNIKQQFKESYRVSQDIGEYIRDKKHINVIEDELEDT